MLLALALSLLVTQAPPSVPKPKNPKLAPGPTVPVLPLNFRLGSR